MTSTTETITLRDGTHVVIELCPIAADVRLVRHGSSGELTSGASAAVPTTRLGFVGKPRTSRRSGVAPYLTGWCHEPAPNFAEVAALAEDLRGMLAAIEALFELATSTTMMYRLQGAVAAIDQLQRGAIKENRPPLADPETGEIYGDEIDLDERFWLADFDALDSQTDLVGDGVVTHRTYSSASWPRPGAGDDRVVSRTSPRSSTSCPCSTPVTLRPSTFSTAAGRSWRPPRPPVAQNEPYGDGSRRTRPS